MFFATKETVPEGVGFTTFGATHLIWLGVLALFCVIAVIIYRKLDLKRRNTMRMIAGGSVVALEIIKDVVMIALGEFTVGHLPFHLCGINVLLIGFDLFRQNKTVRNFLYYFCIPGAMLALLFPNWTSLPCFNFSHIHSFVIHATLVLYPVLLISTDGFKPEIKQMPKSILLLVLIAIPVYILNLIFDTNFMFLMSPETGNPLGLFEKYLGSHLWGFPILLPIVMFIMYIPFFFTKKKEKAEL